MGKHHRFRRAATAEPEDEESTFAVQPAHKAPIPGHSRRSERKHVVILARCRRGRGTTDPVAIVDLTAEGCSISYRCSTLQVGQPVTIKPSVMSGLEGIVRWVSDEGVGIEFVQPLYVPVVEHLQREYAGFGAAAPPRQHYAPRPERKAV